MSSAAIGDAKAIPIEHEVARRGIALKRQGREHVGPCPVCGGTDRFAVNIVKQIWNCRHCAKGGDVIALVMHIDGITFPEAIETLTGNCTAGGTTSRRREVPVPTKTQQRDIDTLLFADRIWRDTVELTPEAIAYFERRKIDISAVPDRGGLRFHARCPWESGTKPCVIGRYTTAIDNEPRGIWRRPVDGSKPKAIGPAASCVIRLWPDDYVEQGLVIGEGVETTLAAASILYKSTLLQPAWATGSAPNMVKFPVLSGIDAITILVDNDANGAGERAAAECAHRWQEAGREAVRLMPRNMRQL
jgi:phage/plasmid primase-like uncharacterized protein